MADKNNFDPYEAFHKLSQLWEKQINDFICLWTNTNDFDKPLNLRTDRYSRYFEQMKKNHEAIASVLNLPTKSDVTNVANLTIQAEEKMEALEKLIWELQDTVNVQSQDLESIVEVSKEVIKLTKQLKTELVKTKKELAVTKDLHAELQEMKFELIKLNQFKAEVATLKRLIEEEQVKEPTLTGAGSTK